MAENDKNYVMDEKAKCIVHYFNVTKQIEKKESEGYLVVGWDKPRCDLDGSYAPVQCLNNKLVNTLDKLGGH